MCLLITSRCLLRYNMMPSQDPVLVRTRLNGHRTDVRGGALPGASGACRGHTASGPPPDAFPPVVGDDQIRHGVDMQ